MADWILKDDTFEEQMTQMVEPYLAARGEERWLSREEGHTIHCMVYRADRPRGVVILSHGFSETAEKYKEIAYYFLRARYHVYLPEHCGHGYSYRLVDDLSLVHVDSYHRYVEDFLYVSRMAKEEYPDLKLYLYGHSMGGEIAAAAAAKGPELYEKIVLSSPMIRPLTGGIPWILAEVIVYLNCLLGRGKKYVIGQKPYDIHRENFETSSAISRVRFEYYANKRKEEPKFQMSGSSYGWLREAARLNHYVKFEGWKRVQAPVMLFQAEDEDLVSKKAQDRYIVGLNVRRPGSAKLMRVPGTRHEIFNSPETIVEKYWKHILRFYS